MKYERSRHSTGIVRMTMALHRCAGSNIVRDTKLNFYDFKLISFRNTDVIVVDGLYVFRVEFMSIHNL